MIERPKPKTPEEAVIQVYDILSSMENTLGNICNNCKEHDKRIKRLEIWQAAISSAMVVVGYTIKIAFDNIGSLVSYISSGGGHPRL